MKRLYFGSWLPAFDIGAAILLTAAIGYFMNRDFCPIHYLLSRDGTALYGSFLAALAALLGFAIAAVAIIANLVAAKIFDSLRRSDEYDNFWLAFTWSIRALAVATLISLIAIFANKYEAAQEPVLLVVLAAILAATLSLVRSGYTLEEVLRKTKDVGKPKVETQTTYSQAP